MGAFSGGAAARRLTFRMSYLGLRPTDQEPGTIPCIPGTNIAVMGGLALSFRDTYQYLTMRDRQKAIKPHASHLGITFILYAVR